MSLTKLHLGTKIVVGNSIVYANSSGEVFVETGGIVLRISDNNHSVTVTSHGNLLQPDKVNGLPAFTVTKR